VVAENKPPPTIKAPTVKTLVCYPIQADKVKMVCQIEQPIVVKRVEAFAEKVKDLVD
jgi:hypothetical protein